MQFKKDSDKKQLLEQLLEASMVMLTINSCNDTVIVPNSYKGELDLRLNVSHRFGLPISITDEGIEMTLTFGGTPFECSVRWKDIYCFVSHATGQVYLFPASITNDVIDGMEIVKMDKSRLIKFGIFSGA